MREILFRGKTTEGKWVQGSLQIGYGWRIIEGKRQIDHRICDLNNKCDNVIPETVGQYTGLIDKNGERIFEGDIVEGHCHSQWSHRLQRCVVEYDRDGFEARHYVEQGGTMRYYSYKVLFSKDVVVIGNIHDNPELLEGEVEK